MLPPILVTSAAQLLGLDEGTVESQILPYAGSIQSQGEVKDYFQGLMGSSAPAQKFVASYVAYRFPSAQASSTSSALAPAALPPNWASSHSRGSSAANSRHPSPAPPSSANRLTEEAKAKMEREFGAGKVYVKQREDESGWGASKNRAQSSGRATPATRDQSPAPAAGSASPAPQQPSKVKEQPQKQSQKVQKPGEQVNLSEGAAAELLTIDRGIKLLTSPSKRLCFCQARQHKLSTYAPICPSCALVLCELNPPSHPCPSCSFAPLVAPIAISSHLSSLQDAREALLEREVARVHREKEQEARERAAIRFPELGGGGGAPQGVPQPRGYSDMASGGKGTIGLSQRIEAAYETGISLNGNKFGRDVAPPPSSAPSKVLRLDMKTKKVKVVSKVKQSAKAAGKEKEAELVVAHDDDDGLRGWLDPYDDGLADTAAAAAPIDLSEDSKRLFRNPAFEVEWVEYVEPLVVEEEAIQDGDAVSGARNVPGAAKREGSAMGEKKGRRKGKGAKGGPGKV